MQDNIGHQVETIENLDRLEYVNIGGVKRMRSLGKQEEYRHGYYEEKFEAKVIKGAFFPLGKSAMRTGTPLFICQLSL